MTNGTEQIETSQQFERNRYFYGKLMTVKDFDTEQSYFNGKRWLINRLLFGTGVVCGLEVDVKPNKKGITIKPGVALDPQGREIVVSGQWSTDDVRNDPLKVAPLQGLMMYHVVLSYKECTKEIVRAHDPSTCAEVCQYGKVEEQYQVDLVQARTPSPGEHHVKCNFWNDPDKQWSEIVRDWRPDCPGRTGEGGVILAKLAITNDVGDNMTIVRDSTFRKTIVYDTNTLAALLECVLSNAPTTISLVADPLKLTTEQISKIDITVQNSHNLPLSDIPVKLISTLGGTFRDSSQNPLADNQVITGNGTATVYLTDPPAHGITSVIAHTGTGIGSINIEFIAAWIKIDPIGVKHIGDTFTITGTTNLAENDMIDITVTSSSFEPTEEPQPGESSGASGTVTVRKADPDNTFSFDVDASTFQPDEYLVRAISQKFRTVLDTQTFRIEEIPSISISAVGAGSYYIGDEIRFQGTNSTATTYLFFTGANLPANGAQMNSDNPSAHPVVNNDAGTFARAPVNPDKTWSFNWNTKKKTLKAGTYTVYAVTAPQDKNHLTGVAFATVSIILRMPFVTAIASPHNVAQGDPFIISGTAEGRPKDGVQIWMFGTKTAFFRVERTKVETDASFSSTITAQITSGCTPDDYRIIVQHPMIDDQFDVEPRQVGNLWWLWSVRDNAGISRLTDTLGSESSERLIEALKKGDDTFTKLSIVIQKPVINISPLASSYTVGDKVSITGTTNLAVGDEIIVTIKTPTGSGTTYKPKVQQGEGGLNGFTSPEATLSMAGTYSMTISPAIAPTLYATYSVIVKQKVPQKKPQKKPSKKVKK